MSEFSAANFLARCWKLGDQDDHQGQKSNNETRIPNPQSCAWLVIYRINPEQKKSNTLTPKTNSQTYWQRAISHVMNEIIFSISSISSCSVQQAAPKQCRKEWNKEQEKRELMHIRSRRWTWSRILRQALRQRRVRVHHVARDTQSSQSARFESHSTECRETCRWRFKSKWRSVKFSSVAHRCKDERTCEETRCCRNEPGSASLSSKM